VHHTKHVKIYIKDIPNVNLVKPKVINLTHIGKTAFNINGITIHSTFTVHLNNNSNELKTLSA
jgi:hypothetical protein